MVIKNETTGKILSDNASKAKTFKQKSFGLILEKKGKSMIFQTRFGIHTFFMKYPIDVVVLDKENKVAALKHSLKPNRIFLWNVLNNTVIEFLPGTLTRSKTKKGDQITL